MTTTDRELLELAAKAAGIRYTVEDDEYYKTRKFFGLWLVFDGEPSSTSRRYFNPLTDDGDALRLAVKLGFLVEVNYGEENQKVIVWDYTEEERRTREYWGDTSGAICSDPYAATRRAIVRAAAEIGRSMG